MASDQFCFLQKFFIVGGFPNDQLRIAASVLYSLAITGLT